MPSAAKRPGTDNELASIEQLTTGDDVTLVAWGSTVSVALMAATLLAKQGIFVEVLGLNQLLPVATNQIASSVSKTGRVVLSNTPKQFLHSVVEGAFWSLESQPVKCGTSEQEIQRALFESLS